MVTAFQIVLLVIIVISFSGVLADTEDIKVKSNLASICIAGITAFIVSVMWL